MGDVPIIGQAASREQDADMATHIAGLQLKEASHKLQIQLIQAECENHYATQKTPNEMFIAMLNLQITQHCLSISSIAGTMALLAAMGVPGVPVPELPTFNNPGETVQ